MIDSYSELHRRGVTHSVEAWSGDRLVGGLYGLSLGATFFGESMFALEQDASKLSFVALVRQLGRWGIPLVDCQVYTPHLAHFGAREWPRRDFLGGAAERTDRPTRLGPWRSSRNSGVESE
jgi:leucyl/phenylalanyl-tRNA--protein transferase